MKRLLIALLVVAFAIPAIAGQNPNVGIFLTSSSTGAPTGVNHKPTPPPGTPQNVYVAFSHLGGGMLAAQWMFQTVGGPAFDSTTNQFGAVGGLTIGFNPAVAPGVSMTTGPAAYPNANGVVVLGKITYMDPEASRVGGYIRIVAYGAGDGGVVSDANNMLDPWCVHSVVFNGMSGNWGWDSEPIPDGNCAAPSPVESATWGSIKALYR
jgi:hypothetical protein